MRLALTAPYNTLPLHLTLTSRLSQRPKSTRRHQLGRRVTSTGVEPRRRGRRALRRGRWEVSTVAPDI